MTSLSGWTNAPNYNVPNSICDNLAGSNSPVAWDKTNPGRCHSTTLQTAQTRCLNIPGCTAVVQDGVGYEPRTSVGQYSSGPSQGSNTWYRPQSGSQTTSQTLSGTAINPPSNMVMYGDFILNGQDYITIEKAIKMPNQNIIYAGFDDNYTKIVMTDSNGGYISSKYYRDTIENLMDKAGTVDKYNALGDATGHYLIKSGVPKKQITPINSPPIQPPPLLQPPPIRPPPTQPTPTLPNPTQPPPTLPNPTQSNLIQSNPTQSNPTQSNPTQSSPSTLVQGIPDMAIYIGGGVLLIIILLLILK